MGNVRAPRVDVIFRATIPSVSEPESFARTLERARTGDRKSLNELARRFYPAVEGLVHHRLASDLRRGRSWLHAQFSTGDVVQTVFEDVLTDLEAFQGASEPAFVGYLAAVVQHRLVDALRFHEASCRDARRRVRIEPGFDAEGGEADPADVVLVAERVERLRTALARFDARERHLLRARMEGLASFRELAEQLGYGSESAARRAFFDAQARLALWLGDER
jgi:RNA polymerase sigma factor (sigma-70 family)